MIHRIKRKISKNQTHHVNTQADLNAAAINMGRREILGHVYDPTRYEKHSRLINYFMILGPHEALPGKPALLFAYPSHIFPYKSDEFNRITQFCYPTGLIKSKLQPTEYVINQFVFGLNDNGSLQFCICTHVNLANSRFHAVAKAGNEGLFCFCSVTSMPMFSAHYNFHEFLLLHLLGITTPPPNMNIEGLLGEGVITEGFQEKAEETKANFLLFNPPLRLHPDDPLFASTELSLITKEFMSSIEFYFRIIVDDTKTVTYSLSEVNQMYVVPKGESVLEIARYCYDVLFSCLSVENIVRFFRALLLESHILVVSSDINKVTFGTLAALPLVLPLSCKCSMLPLIPDNDDYFQILDSPVPFVFGALATKNLASYPISPDITVVNLDTNTVMYPQDVQHLPGAPNLRKDITALLSQMNVLVPKVQPMALQAIEFWTRRMSCLLPTSVKRRIGLSYSFCPLDTNRILDLFQTFLKPFVDQGRLAKCILRDTTSDQGSIAVFIKEFYFIDRTPKDNVFLESFIATQAFTSYFDQLFNS